MTYPSAMYSGNMIAAISAMERETWHQGRDRLKCAGCKNQREMLGQKYCDIEMKPNKRGWCKNWLPREK